MTLFSFSVFFSISAALLITWLLEVAYWAQDTIISDYLKYPSSATQALASPRARVIALFGPTPALSLTTRFTDIYENDND